MVMVSVPPRALRVKLSTSLTSIVMAPTLRVNRMRPPLAEISMLSLMLRAVEQQRVDVGLAFDRVAAVARIPLEGVLAGTEQGHVVALVAVDEVVAVAADQPVVAVAAEDRIVARRRRRG